MVAFRDLVCAQAVGKMTEMGCFEEEFITYGCAYLQEGHIKYLVTGKSQTIEDFIVECALADYYPTPIKERLDRSLVPTDGREELKQGFKLKLVRELKRAYNRAFFDALAVLAQMPANDSAYPLLLEMQDKLAGTYDETMLRLYQELARLALKRKVLTKDSYRAISAWLAEVRRQMADDAVVKEQYSRNFAGYAYIGPDGRLKYYVNAQTQVTQERHRAEIAKGSLVTPVLQKTYWFKSENQLMSKRQEFEELLKRAVDESYMQLLKTIHQLPTQLDSALYQEQLAFVRQHCSDEAVEAFRSYGRQWGVED